MARRVITLGGRILSTTSNSSSYICLAAQGGRDNTLADRAITFDYDATIVGHRARVTVNTKDATTVLSVSAGGVDLASINVGAGLTGEFSAGTIAPSGIASGQGVALHIDNSASTAGTISIHVWIVQLAFVAWKDKKFHFISFGFYLLGATGNSNVFLVPNHATSSGTEANRRMIIDGDHILSRFRANVPTNTKNGSTVFGIRDDGVSIGTTVSLGAGVTGLIDSGALNTMIESGSFISQNINLSGSSAGAIDVQPFFATLKAIVPANAQWGRCFFTGVMLSITANELGFYALNLDGNKDLVEVNRQIGISHEFYQERVRATVSVNSKNGATVIAFRDDGVSVGTITVGAGVTGAVDSGELGNTIAAESQVNFAVDTTASSSGSFEACMSTSGRSR